MARFPLAFAVVVAAVAAPALGGEWSLSVPTGVPGEIRPNSMYELFIPDSIPSNQPVRGLLAVFNYEGGAEMYTDPRIREWAARENLGIVRHLVRNTNSMLTVAKTQGAVDQMFNTALPTLAASSGRPEVAHTSLIWTGLSQAGWGSIALGNLSPTRTLAVLPIHDSTGDRDPALGDSLQGLSIPTLHLLGTNDNVNQGLLATGNLYAQTIVGLADRRRGNGALTSIAIQRNTGHTQWDGRNDTDLNFMLDWVSTVVDLRVPSVIPTDVPYVPATLAESSGTLGTLGLAFNQGTPFVSVTSASVESYAPVGARDKWWLPTDAFGTAWQQYNSTGTYAPIPEPSTCAMLVGPLVALRRTRR